jgi:TRAP-type C4-dicarboxylate transport system substrate-binding protein
MINLRGMLPAVRDSRRRGTVMNFALSRRLLGLCLVGLVAALPSIGHAQGAPMVMKLGTATINDSQHEWLKRFAAEVEKTSNGRIKVEVYPASQLGAIPRMIEQTQFGSIQGWVGPAEFLSGVDMRYEVLSAPGLFKDLAHANRVLQDPKFDEAFLGIGANKGLKGLGLFISGPACFVTRVPVHKMEDLKGKKIRVLSAPLQMEQIRAIDATPVPMPLGEVLPALQQGALDSVMSDVPIFVALRYSSAAKYLINTEHALLAAVTVISKTWFDKLPADLQKVVEDAGRKVSADIYQWSVDDINNGIDTWSKGGGEVIRLEPAEQSRLMAKLLPIGAEVTAKRPDEKALFAVLQDAVKRTQ